MDVVPFFSSEWMGSILNNKILNQRHRERETYAFFLAPPFFLKFLGFFPAVILVNKLILAQTLKGIPLLIIKLINRFHI
jgi:hypothetical protein